jgi:hypothetical protein
MTDNLTKFQLELRNYMEAVGDLLADDVSVVAMPVNVTPAPTAAAWSYIVPFEIRSARTGEVLPINGTIAATVGDTSTAGTATVSSATPTVFMGRGSVTLSGDAAAWLDTETATLTLTWTNFRGGTDVDTFVVTFSA